MNTENLQYKDRVLWIVFYPLAAFSFLFIANENNFSDLIRLPSFITDVLFAVTVTYCMGFYIRWITFLLDRRWPWKENLKRRLLLQALLGVFLPLLVSISLELLYLHSIDIAFSLTSVLTLELPLACLLLLLANTYYLAHYLFHHKHTELVTVVRHVPVVMEQHLQFITVQKGYTEAKLPLSDCAFIKSVNKILWLHTFEGEQYRLAGTLDEWEQKLKPSFFRINRQYLATSAAIQSVETTDTRKLKVDFLTQFQEDVFISKANATGFRRWWKNECPL